MEFRLLGPLEARERGRPVELGTPRVRTLLAALLLQANRVVSVDELVDRLWGAYPPANPRRTVQTNVARLRLALGDGSADLVRTRERGYLIERYIRVITDAPFGRTECDVVLHAVPSEDLDLPVVHLHRTRNDDLPFRMGEDVPDPGLEVDDACGDVELLKHRPEDRSVLCHGLY